MLRRLARGIWDNIGTLLLAFALAFAVWVSAVVAADPNEERTFPRAIPLELRNADPAMVVLGSPVASVTLTLSAPGSLWDRLVSETEAIRAFLDLDGLDVGQHTLPVQVESAFGPVRVVSIAPEEVTIELEMRATVSFPVSVSILGSPALGFHAEPAQSDPAQVSVSGPESLVAEVETVRAILDISEAREPVSEELELQALDGDGNVISGVTIDPQTVTVSQEIVQSGGYRDVAVNVQTVGSPAAGFRVVSITVTPPVVTLFSTDSQLIAGLPGFVSTQPLDLTGVEEDLEARLSLDLPEGVSVSGESQSIEVLVGIAPIESSIPLSVQIEFIGLGSGLSAEVSPQTVNVILSGPLSVLESLQPGDVRLLVDLTDLEEGAHLLEPEAEILPENVTVLSITPSSVEVVISR